MTAKFVNPLEDLGPLLLSVEKPARYTGGEYGMLAKRDAALRTVIAFPDLYEIGMSNQALRILYNTLNSMDGISCDRAFAPAPDFERLLKEHGIPLYGLDTGIALCDADLLMFTLGYELGITSVLCMLEASGIPIRAEERGEGHPVVIAGGPCVSNPLPYALFMDAFWIGEAEDGFFGLAEQLRDMKLKGEDRAAMLARIAAHPSVWVRGKEKAVRAADAGFADRKAPAPVFPVPSIRITQHHGVVEIMRGCPNGCRFCHAGVWYRPMRQKDAAAVEAEAAECVAKAGYREISLSSLSSGDYRGIEALIGRLNARFGASRVSFQLPSLHISTFSLPLLEKISAVRKSGLTFAVETPLDGWQAAINKRIGIDTVADILAEAKKRGWKSAKLYFMIGLPVRPADTADSEDALGEDAAIIAFVSELSRRTRLKFSMSVGVFIPKPHTPFERSAQMKEGTAREMLYRIRDALKKQGHRVNLHDPFTSLAEGVIARGDEGAGLLIEAAYRAGCRLDAWGEFFQKDVWRRVFDEHGGYVERVTGERADDESLAWEPVLSRVSKAYIAAERGKSRRSELNEAPCSTDCADRCGVCSGQLKVAENGVPETLVPQAPAPQEPAPQELATSPPPTEKSRRDPRTYRILFSFTKQERAVFLPHLALIEVFSMASLRAGVPVLYTAGFNPLPRLDFAAPLSLGIRASAEIASIDTERPFAAADFKRLMNGTLPEGIRIAEALDFVIASGAKKHSVASLLWGFEYAGEQEKRDYVEARNEKSYRQERVGEGGVFGLTRLRVLASIGGGPASYFDVYRELYAPKTMSNRRRIAPQ